MSQSSLHNNPFCLLGATVRDNRARIVALAEERSLQLDPGICERARSELTNPRARLSCEIAWLPNLAPSRANALMALLDKDTFSIRLASGLPSLAYANLISAGLETIRPTVPAVELVEAIQQLASVVEMLPTDEVLRSINEDRVIAGFPEVKSPEHVEEELSSRKRHFRDVIKTALNKLPSAKLIDVMTAVVQGATQAGKTHASGLIDDLVDSYEVESQGFLQKESANIQKLIEAIRTAAAQGKDIQVLVDKLIAVTSNWHRVAHPIQLSCKARGIEHKPSVELAFSIRSLAVDLYNKHDLLRPAQQLTDVLVQRFAEVPAVADKTSEDRTALENISAEQEQLKDLAPLRNLCEAAIKKCEGDPKTADVEGQQLLANGQRALGQLEARNPTRQLLSIARNQLASALVKCAIASGNATEKWQSCIPLLEAAHALAEDADLLKHIAKNLDVVRTNQRVFAGLEPISKAPGLSTINGIGTTLYGSTDKDPETGSFISTYYFTFFFIPVFPLARYRVIQNGTSYRFLGKAPLRPFDKWHIAITLGFIAWVIFGHK